MEDRGERVALLEPLLPGQLPAYLPDLAGQLAVAGQALPETTAHRVRALNALHSLQIEGLALSPAGIERAAARDYSDDPAQAALQAHAAAHMDIQAWLDAGGLLGKALTVEGIRAIHARYYGALPAHLRRLDSDPTVAIEPGQWRDRDVQVGRHVPISAGAIPRFLARLEAGYANQTGTMAILAAVAAHHRLLWIHPFVDGNGRVARLALHAALVECAGAQAWPLSRGLALQAQDYRRHLAACDQGRRHDFDGRGHLSEAALLAYIEWFLRVALEQAEWMTSESADTGLEERG